MNNLPNQVTILPGQAARISREAAKTGASVGVSPSGSYQNSLIIDTGRGIHVINTAGANISTSFE